MCRLNAYLGSPVLLDQLLPDFAGSAEQATYNFGIGWYAPDESPAVYTQLAPVCLDSNLPHLARSVSSGLWLFQARDTAPILPPGQTLLQPFHDEDFLFTHQGSIDNFRNTLCPLLRRFLAPEIEARMQGHTEAEYLFATLRHLLMDDDEMSIDQALAEMFVLLDDWLDDLPASLNIVISDGEGLYAARYAVNRECAPLYYNADDETYPDAQLIGTLPFTQSGFWQPVPGHHILILNVDEPPELIAL